MSAPGRCPAPGSQRAARWAKSTRVCPRRVRWRLGASAWVALLMLAAALPAAAADLEAARNAAERRDWATALPAYRALAVQAGSDADVLIEAARVHGFADRHTDAVALYRQALAAAPQRRMDILPSLAWQTLWAGDADAARALFTEWIQSQPDAAAAHDGLGQALDDLQRHAEAAAAHAQAARLDPTMRRSALRAGQSWLWADRPLAALAVYQGLRQAQPDDRAAAWGMGRALNAAGRHRAAAGAFEALAPARDDDERLEMARALDWSDHADLALPLLGPAQSPEAVWLREYRVRRTLRPWLSAELGHSIDRDRLETWGWQLGGGLTTANGLALNTRVRHLQLRDAAGSPQGTELTFGGRWRVGGPTADAGSWWPALRLSVIDIAGWQPLTGAAQLTWVADDHWRVDAELGRERVDTPRALANRVTVDVLSIGFDHRPMPRWLLTGAVAALRFDEGNQRMRWLLRAEHAVPLAARSLPWRPRLTLGADASGFSASRPTGPQVSDRGYWNPARYREARLYATLTAEQRPFDLRLRLGLGWAREVDGFGNRSSGQPHQWELALGWDLAPAWRLQVSAAGAGAGLGVSGGAAGYWRRSVSVGLTGWF
jgi:tetratricopeptide (TPR) repeat protein